MDRPMVIVIPKLRPRGGNWVILKYYRAIASSLRSPRAIPVSYTKQLTTKLLCSTTFFCFSAIWLAKGNENVKNVCATRNQFLLFTSKNYNNKNDREKIKAKRNHNSTANKTVKFELLFDLYVHMHTPQHNNQFSP